MRLNGIFTYQLHKYIHWSFNTSKFFIHHCYSVFVYTVHRFAHIEHDTRMLYIIIFYKIDVCLYEFPGLRKSTKSFSGCSIIFFQNIMQSYRAFPCNLSVHRFHDMFLYCRELSYIHKSRTIPWHHFRANDTNVIKTGPMMD